MKVGFDVDVRSTGSSVHVPTLVAHMTGHRVCNLENGRFLARAIPERPFVSVAAHVRSPLTSRRLRVALQG